MAVKDILCSRGEVVTCASRILENFKAPYDSTVIAKLKAANCDIVTGVFLPPDFATFWAQCGQQGYKPKAVTIAKALLFPASIEALGDRGVGLSSEEWWSPNHPFKSGLTGQSAADLCAAFTKATGKQWVQPIGFKHALLEVAFDILKRAKDVTDPKAIVDAMAADSGVALKVLKVDGGMTAQ